jgi:Fe-S-cluster formation regulator IscX/YfhJ
MCSILEAFGDVSYEERVVRMQEKIEEKKNIAIKKEVDPKFVDVTQRLVSFNDFQSSIKRLENFDINLARLGYVKSQRLDA